SCSMSYRRFVLLLLVLSNEAAPPLIYTLSLHDALPISNLEFMKLVSQTKPYLEEIASPIFIAQGHKDGMVPFRSAYSLEKEIGRSEEHTSELQSRFDLVCRLLLEKKKRNS